MSELAYEASDEASENELLERSLSVWRGWSNMKEDFTPIPLDIHTASSIGQYECVRALIAHGEVELDRKNVGGWTPLMYACYIGHDHIVSLLIDAGCNINLKNHRGQTPLMLAASCGNESVGRSLLRKGAELEAADRMGWTALFHATYSGHQNFVRFLLDQRANMDAVEPSTGMTPFMQAALEGHEIIVQLFLQHGVKVHAKAFNGDNARSLALIHGYMKIVSLIDNHVMPHSTLRSEPGLDDYLSSSDEIDKRQRPHQRNSRAKSKGPSIRDGPEAIARMIDRTRTVDRMCYPNLLLAKGFVSFPRGEDEQVETQLSYRDVTSPINQEDYTLDSSGGKDSCDYNDDSNAFSKTGAITIKSSSSSSGGLIAALGLSRQNSADSDEFILHNSGTQIPSEIGSNSANPAFPCVPLNCANIPESDRKDAEIQNQVHSPQRQKSAKSSCFREDGGKGLLQGIADNGGITPDTLVNARLFFDEKSQLETSKPKTGEMSQECYNLFSDVNRWSEKDVESQSDKCELFQNLDQQNSGSVPSVDNLAFHVQFGEVIFPEALNNISGHCGTGNFSSTGSPYERETHTRNQKQDRSVLRSLLAVDAASPTLMPGSKIETVTEVDQGDPGIMIGTMGGIGQSDLVAGIHSTDMLPRALYMKRRSSCQARLLHLPPCDLDIAGKVLETRHRRRSANSPPAFHREPFVRGADSGCGTGRVSCLSDIPANAGPLAGYPVTSSIPASSDNQFVATDVRGDDGGDTDMAAHKQHQTPVAAITPTCVPASLTAATSCLAPQNPSKTLDPDPSLSPSSPQLTDCLCSVPAKQTNHHLHNKLLSDSEDPRHRAEEKPLNHNSLSELVRELPGSSDAGMTGRGEFDLATLLDQLGLCKYTSLFLEQDVDLQVFLSLTDNDLKEIGIKLFGPRKKMTNAIARWHSQAPAARSSLEQAYADRLEGEMQEMAIQLNQAYDSVEKLKAQVKQERQLRSVTESCLMEERATWQRVRHTLIDIHQRCHDLASLLNKLISCQAEMREKPLFTSNNSRNVIEQSKDGAEICTMSLEQLWRLCDQYICDLRHQCNSLTNNVDRIVSSPTTASIACDFPLYDE